MRRLHFLPALLLSVFLASPSAAALAHIGYLGDDEVADSGSPQELTRRPGRPRDARPPSWEMLATTGALPPARHVNSLTLDPVGRNAILFGGWGGAVWDDLWALSMETGTWSPMSVPGGPGGRWAHMSVYDPIGRRMIVFGGATSPVPGHENPRNDVWALGLDGVPAWHEIEVLGTPPSPRFAGAMVFDTRRNRVLLFGGFDGTFRDDTWELDLHGTPIWRQLDPAGSTPPGRDAPAYVYDERFDRMILFAGFNGTSGDNPMNDLWALDLKHLIWKQLSPPGAPNPRREQSCAYDGRSDRMLLWGGGDSAGLLDQVWVLNLDREPSWQKIVPEAGAAPTARAGHAAVYDGATRRLVGFGGYALGVGDENEFIYSDKTWALRFGGRRRGHPHGSEPEAGGLMTSESGSVAPEHVLGIAAARPTRAGLAVDFTLSTSAPARLEVFSVTGRRLAARDVGALGAGRHEIELGEAADLAPGIYFMRLVQSEAAVTRKVALTR